MRRSIFKYTKNTVKPIREEDGWLMAEHFDALSAEGFDTTTLGTDLVYLIDQPTGRVFNPVDRTVASRGYVSGWKYGGERLYWTPRIDGWVAWDELTRKEQIRWLGERKRWFPPGEPIPEPKP